MNVIDFKGASELKALADRLRKVKQEGESWPLLVCGDVLALSDRWETPAVRSAVGRCTINAWLKREANCGTWGLARFRKMQAIIDRMGESIRREGWDWRAAQWVYNNVPDGELRVVLDVYPTWVKANGGSRLSQAQVVARVKTVREELNRKASGQ